jgi:TolB protein
LTRITDDDSLNHSLAWSPDSRRLAFVASVEGSGTINTVRPDGNDRKLILRRAALGGDLTWSPDGDSFAFSTYREEPNVASIDTVRVDGTRPELIASFVVPFVAPIGPSWSPDSKHLAYGGSVGTGPPRVPPNAGPDAVAIIPGTFKIFVSSVKGRHRARRLTRAAGGEWDPRWMPRGQRILFTREHGRRTDLMIASPGESPSLVAAGFIDFEADWSPDGRQIAVSGVRFAGDRRYHLWVIDVRTGRMRKLADDVLPPRPSWSPDGRRIAYAAESGLSVVGIRDGVTTTLARSGRA